MMSFIQMSELVYIEVDGIGALDIVEDVVYAAAYKEQTEVLYAHESVLCGVAQHLQQRVVVALGVEDGYGLICPAELL